MNLMSKLGSTLKLATSARLAIFFFAFTVFGVSILGGSAVSAKQAVAPVAQADSHPEFPLGPGRDVTLRLCSKCHSPNNILAMGRTSDGWQELIIKMTTLGLQGTDEDFTATLDYLTASFPPKVNVNKATAAQMAPGLALTLDEAKAIVSYREKNGDFKSIDDLKKVDGVDSSKLDAKKNALQF